MPPEVMSSISPAKTPQGVLFTCARHSCLPVPETLPGPAIRGKLDGVQDPGNVGTVLRTLTPFDADGLLLTGGCADPFGPKTVRASMGRCSKPSGMERNAGGAGSLKRRSGIPLYGAALRLTPLDARQADYSRCALAIGSEGRGPSAGRCWTCATKPCSSHVSPLRVAERGHRGGGAAVGKLAINEGGETAVAALKYWVWADGSAGAQQPAGCCC